MTRKAERDQQGPFWRDLRAARRALVLKYLSGAGYHAGRAALNAGVYEKTWRRWMAEHGIRLSIVRELKP